VTTGPLWRTSENASTAFAVSYYQQLATLPSHRRVLVNLYYDPFDTSKHCLDMSAWIDPT
jgi:hypothetical protein